LDKCVAGLTENDGEVRPQYFRVARRVVIELCSSRSYLVQGGIIAKELPGCVDGVARKDKGMVFDIFLLSEPGELVIVALRNVSQRYVGIEDIEGFLITIRLRE
jgi:hypothetical protein